LQFPFSRTFTILALCAAPLAAQTTGSLSGVVLDITGAVVPDVEVRAVNQSTAVERVVQTDSKGRYVVLGLAPGFYEVRTSDERFMNELRGGVTLSAGQAVRVDVMLEPKHNTVSIEVVADASPIAAGAADFSREVSSQELHELPLNGRDLFQSAAYEPGVHLPTAALRESLTTGLGTAFSVNGATPYQNGFRLDGVYINEATNAVPSGVAGLTLGVEAVQDLQIAANPYSAEYGRAAGAVMTAVSKSGGNDYHGDLYWYFRNSALDAKNFFDQASEPIPPLRRNQFGGLFGGPIRENKAFFLVNYEGFRGRLGSTRRPAVPTLAARRGELPSGSITVNPAVAPYLDLYPAPNGRDFGDGTAEYVNEGTLESREDHFSVKLDLLPDDLSRFTVRYTYDDGDDARPDAVRIWEFQNTSRYNFLHTEFQRIVSPTTLFHIRAAFSQVKNQELGEVIPDVPASLSLIPGQPLGSLETTGIQNIGGFGARILPRRFDLQDWQLNGDFTSIQGRHTLRLGAGFDRIGFDQVADISAIGLFRFNSLENLLLGNPITAEAVRPGSSSQREWSYQQYFFYLQDDIRLAPGFDLSVGLRYETVSTPSEAQNRVATLPNPLTDSETTVGGPLFDNPSRANFAPRASLAWDPTGNSKTVFRAGAGIFFDLIGSRELVVAGMRVPPIFQRVFVFRPSGFPDLPAVIEGRNPSSAIDGLQFDLNQPYVARWRFGIDQALGDRHTLKLEYVGARGIHLMGKLGTINTPFPETLPDGRQFIAAGSPRVNPAFGDIGMRRSQFNSFYQGFNALLLGGNGKSLRYQVKYTWGKSIDEASAALFDEFANADLVPTVWNYRANRGPSSFDLRHAAVANFSWDLPQPTSANLKPILGGWQMHGALTLQSGAPFSPTVGFDRARLGAARGDLGQRPDYLAGPGQDVVLSDPSRWFDPNAYGLPEAGFLGNLGRNTLNADGILNLDLAVHKDLFRTERQAWTLRLEAFNLTNHANFAIPSSLQLFNSGGNRVGSAGRVTGTTTPSRQIQAALRWSF